MVAVDACDAALFVVDHEEEALQTEESWQGEKSDFHLLEEGIEQIARHSLLEAGRLVSVGGGWRRKDTTEGRGDTHTQQTGGEKVTAEDDEQREETENGGVRKTGNNRRYRTTA